ncbi:glycoside hydrolase family 26 protein [Craurococcus roseus]
MTDAERDTTRRQAIGLALAGAAAPLRSAGSQPRSPDAAGGRATTDKKPPLLGVFVGNTLEDVPAFEQWLGREVDGVLGFTGGTGWAEIGDPGWFIELWSRIDRPVFWSVPLVPARDRRALDDAANGIHNAVYKRAARKLAAFRPQDDRVFIRTGWEFNGDWFPWSAAGRERAFVNAFRQFVDSFRSVSNRFRFEWNVNMGASKTDPERCYPGDAHVDVVGMDFYWHLQYTSPDPLEAWDKMLSGDHGLRWHQDFAAGRGKPTAYSEWGVTTDNAEPILERVKAWFDDHDVLYQTYWDSNAGFPGKLSRGSFAGTGSAYVRLFSQREPRRGA